jgi:L-seryl-tRNA(Ser) seleniumtransferase
LIARAGRPLVIEALRAWADARRGADDVIDESACARWCEARLAGLVQPSQRNAASSI